jgi:ribonuclease HI
MQTVVVARGLTFHRDYPGTGDNNDAEWLALIHALSVARSLDATEVTFLGDSALVVDQANGVAACRAPRFQVRLAEFTALAAGFDHVLIRRVRRTQNLAGIALERIHGKL